MLNKQEIRDYIKRQKALLSSKEKSSAAQAVYNKLSALRQISDSSKILLYHSLPDELSTQLIIKKLYDEKELYLPRVNGVNLEILPYTPSSLKTGSFNIKEPAGNNIINIADINLVVVPGVAFDLHGNRIGRGKGFYDRLLNDTSAIKIGICYDCQIINYIPNEPHDIKMNIIISDKRIIYC